MNTSDHVTKARAGWIPVPLPYPLPTGSELEDFSRFSVESSPLRNWTPEDSGPTPVLEVPISRASLDPAFAIHRGGKIRIQARVPIASRQTLSRAYGSGAARVSCAIARDRDQVWTLTGKGNSVAVVTDGTGLPGLGNIGAEAAMPAVEGKAMLFREFGNIDAYPLCLRANDPAELTQIIDSLSVGFGAINLTGIAAPGCFAIERQLQEQLDIPVFDDYQHGTAIVVLAGLINALRLLGLKLRDTKIVVAGAGAAGTAIAKLLLRAGARNLLVCDRQGILHERRAGLEKASTFLETRLGAMSAHSGDRRPAVSRPFLPARATGCIHASKMAVVRRANAHPGSKASAKRWLAHRTNPQQFSGSLARALEGAQVFIGASAPGVLEPYLIETMAPKPIIFALATPTPEIRPEEAVGAFIVGSGQSDCPNHINNVLAFPGIFRGALDVRATRINEQMKLAAARAIARCIHPRDLAPGLIVPSVFNRGVVKRVAQAVREAAVRTGVARVTRGVGE
ncbi:MAG: NAD-dependent malic enzyme [Verrucomicrobia bacterium]|nr:MAG: NAD-dependent malic enzyme [Verrucomicrobiota bacterium]